MDQWREETPCHNAVLLFDTISLPLRCRLTDAVAGDVSPGKRCPPDKRFPSAHRIYPTKWFMNPLYNNYSRTARIGAPVDFSSPTISVSHILEKYFSKPDDTPPPSCNCACSRVQYTKLYLAVINPS